MGKLQARRIAAYQLSDLLADQDNVHFSEEFRNLAHDLTPSRRFPTPTDDNPSNPKGLSRDRGQMVLHAESLWFWWYFSG